MIIKNINWKKFKSGMSCILILTSLTGCAKGDRYSYGSFEDDAYEPVRTFSYDSNEEDSSTYDSDKEVSDLSLNYSYFSKDMNLSDYDIERFNEKCGEDRVVLSVEDFNSMDYISGIDFIVRDSSGKVIDRFTTNDDCYVISGLEVGKTYTIEEVNVPSEYGNASVVYRFTFEGFDSDFVDGEKENYYVIAHLLIQKEKMEDIILKAEGKYASGRFLVSAVDTNGDNLDGARFLVVNEENELVEQWVSTKTSHVVSGLSDGKYTVIIEEPPMGYELESAKSVSSSDDVESSSICYDFSIHNSSSLDTDFEGVDFYFVTSRDRNLSNKSKVLSHKFNPWNL